MKTNLIIIAFILKGWALFAQPNNSIRLNQVGFFIKGPKIAAVIGSAANTFSIKSTDRSATYFTGELSAASTWTSSGESVKTADFSNFVQPGEYVIDVQGLGYSYSFSIGNDILTDINRKLTKAYYYNRCSVALPATYAGKWSRNLGHPDTEVIILPSSSSNIRPAGTKVSSPKGWYDAGDFNLYITNSGIAVYSLLSAYEHYQSYYDTLKLNIPESDNNIPDILDEVKWNTDWMLTMQDPSDGGVYFKKTDAKFDGFEMPESDKVVRYMCKKTTSSAFDFAASMAITYRVFRKFDNVYAIQCLNAAIAAYKWGIANEDVMFSNPVASGEYPAIVTGDYIDTDISDEYQWASNELYIATRDESYYTKWYDQDGLYNLPNWNRTRTLGLISLAFHRKNLTPKGFSDTSSIKNKVISMANSYSNYQKNSPYKIVMGHGGNAEFEWGSNGFAARQSFILLNAYRINGNEDFLKAALSNVDYILGRNAVGYSFITGVGDRQVMNIHHRQSAADGITEPVPGWMVSGPSNVNYDGCTNYINTPAISYFDQLPCYTKNEVDINWNGVAAYVTAAKDQYKLFNDNTLTSLKKTEDKYSTDMISLHIYPNPSNGEVNVVLDSKLTEKYQLQVIDSFGAVVYEKSLKLLPGENKYTINTSKLTKGLYIFHFKSATNNIRTKHLIE